MPSSITSLSTHSVTFQSLKPHENCVINNVHLDSLYLGGKLSPCEERKVMSQIGTCRILTQPWASLHAMKKTVWYSTSFCLHMAFNWHKLIELNDVDTVFIEMLFLSEDTSNRSISNSLLTKKLLSARCLLCQCLTVQFFVRLREFKLCIWPLGVLQWRQIVGSFGDSWV